MTAKPKPKKRVDSNAKGSGFEREVCLALSLWVSNGARTDLFRRNIMSGGRFTIALARQEDHGSPGDMTAAHPLAFDFMSQFLIECKSYKNLDWPGFIYEDGKSFLGSVIELCRHQGAHKKLQYMVVAKQNRRATLVIMPAAVGRCALASAWPAGHVSYHTLHTETYLVMSLMALTHYVKPQVFLKAIHQLRSV